jgi:DNA-binding transcriptional MerR regulator
MAHSNMRPEMSENSYSLNDLAHAVGIEPRTIRSYIERGLLPGAEARGRGASYSREHLSRLQVIKSLRRARPNIALSEIRILLQGLNPEQIHSLAGGSITAATRAIDESMQPDDAELLDADDSSEILNTFDWDRLAGKLTGAERLVCLLREVSGFVPPAPSSKVEGWQRIAVTPDVELSVRAEFDRNQLAAFRDLADLLRHLLQHTNALSTRGDE